VCVCVCVGFFLKILQQNVMTSTTHDGAATLAACTGGKTYHFCIASFPPFSWFPIQSTPVHIKQL
jgi:hypothetical protein